MSAWLREQGFTVLDKSHANYVRTGVSIPTTMSMAHLKDIAGLPGPDSTDLRPVQALMQDSLVARQFKALGYRYFHIGSWWSPNAHDVAADVNLNVAGPSDFVSALYDESAVPAAIKRLKLEHVTDDKRDRHYKHNVYGLDALASMRRRARAQVRLRARPAPPPAHRLRPRRPLHDHGRGGRAVREGAARASARLHEHAPEGDPRRASSPSPRTSARSSSSRPTRDPNRRSTGRPARRPSTGPTRATTTSRSSTGS